MNEAYFQDQLIFGDRVSAGKMQAWNGLTRGCKKLGKGVLDGNQFKKRFNQPHSQALLNS